MLCLTIKDGSAFYVGEAKIICKRDGGRTKVYVEAPPLVKILRAELVEEKEEAAC